LFLRRQTQVAAVYAQLISGAVLNPARFVEYLEETGGWAEILKVIRSEIGKAIREEIPVADKAFIESAVEELMLEFSSLDHTAKCLSYFETRLGIRQLIADRLQKLPPEDFENMLHPVFKEDEPTLISLGGVLGAAVGVLQAWLL